MTHTYGLELSWPNPNGATTTATALELELAAAPGTTVSYNNHGAQLVAEVIRRATEVPIDEHAAANVFAPLGIEQWAWDRDTDGLPHGMSALQLRADDLGRIGLLSLRRGVWNGSMLFSDEWELGIVDRAERSGCSRCSFPKRLL